MNCLHNSSGATNDAVPHDAVGLILLSPFDMSC
jgi:hypothetical protein